MYLVAWKGLQNKFFSILLSIKIDKKIEKEIHVSDERISFLRFRCSYDQMSVNKDVIFKEFLFSGV